MKKEHASKVITKWSFNGEQIHEILFKYFWSISYTRNEEADTTTCTYKATPTQIRKALIGHKKHDLINIEKLF